VSVNPIGGITNVSSLLQPTAAQIAGAQGTVPGSATSSAAQTAPTADAAQAWEEAMRAAMGDQSSSADSSSDPLSSLATQNAAAQTAATQSAAAQTAGAQSAAAPATAAQTALSPEALAALVSGNSTAPTDPLITSLSAPSADTTQAQPVSAADASSYV
jgi:hypothetical protein